MHETTAAVLLVVVLGQIFIFTVAGVAMWLAGEFGERPRWRRWRTPPNRDEMSGLRARQTGAAAISDDRRRLKWKREPAAASPDI